MPVLVQLHVSGALMLPVCCWGGNLAATLCLGVSSRRLLFLALEHSWQRHVSIQQLYRETADTGPAAATTQDCQLWLHKYLAWLLKGDPAYQDVSSKHNGGWRRPV